MSANAPIAIFDSGVGGLTIVEAVKRHLPNERVIYLGDTAHLPYGDKSPEVLRGYVARITRFLLSTEPKALIIACNTASAVARDVVQRLAGDVPVFEVISPAVAAALHETSTAHIGVIGTQTTMSQNIYLQQLMAKNPRLNVIEKATPLLVPLIEEDWLDHALCGQVIEAYLSDTAFRNIDTLILGCTHYPVLEQHIGRYFEKRGQEVRFITSSEAVANELEAHLAASSTLAPAAAEDSDRFYVTDFTIGFQKMVDVFFPEKVKLEKLDLSGFSDEY